MILGIGTDIQLIDEMQNASSLLSPGLMFTESEINYINRGDNRFGTLATLFSVKEAFFKAMPTNYQWSWVDIEFHKALDGSPNLSLGGLIRRYPQLKSWQVSLSLSHSGDYVVSFLIIETGA